MLKGITSAAIGGSFVVLSIVGKRKKKNSVYTNEPEQLNRLVGKKVIFVHDDNDPENADGVKGHSQARCRVRRNQKSDD